VCDRENDKLVGEDGVDHEVWVPLHLRAADLVSAFKTPPARGGLREQLDATDDAPHCIFEIGAATRPLGFVVIDRATKRRELRDDIARASPPPVA